MTGVYLYNVQFNLAFSLHCHLFGCLSIMVEMEDSSSMGNLILFEWYISLSAGRIGKGNPTQASL